MQAYIDRDDAELEQQSLAAEGMAGVDNHAFSTAPERRTVAKLFAVLSGFAVLAIILAVNFGSAPFDAKLAPEPPVLISASFVIEEPEPEPEPLKPKPKPKPIPEVKPEEVRPIERLRSVPDQKTQEYRKQETLNSRTEVADVDRDVQQESVTKRTAPAINTPVIAAPTVADQRSLAVQDQGRRDGNSEVVMASSKTRAEVASGETRTVAESGLSRVKLDPYHYRMVNVCLRQCVKSMFTHAGLDAEEARASKDWLNVARGGSYFEFKHKGRWVRFVVDVASINDISSIDFVNLPDQWTTGDATESLLEEATRNLCRLLQYDDCFSKL